MLCKKTPNTLKDRKNALLSASFVVVLLSLVMLPLRLYAQPTAQELTEKGDSCRMVGKYKKALEYFQQAYDAPAVANDVNMQLQLLERIMRTHDVLRHWKEMPESSYRLFTLAKEHGDSAHTAMALMIQGKRLHILGKTQEGMRVCLHATEMMKRTNFEHKNHELANFYAILAKLYCNEGNYGEEHHYYVDRKDVKRNSKIYINDAVNGATQFKEFYDLSKSSTLNEYVKDCQNLEFILHTNVTLPSGSPTWTPIGDEGHCFSGNFHGDGYHIDGLDNSLFGHLCGNVYNLGVTGSFTSAGIADTGDGYVENCWISTSATSGFPAGVKAVFGNPTDEGKKIVNCYYPEGLDYDATDNSHGLARPMPKSAFYNGTVGYDLNGFYLFKRYYDHIEHSGSTAGYKYYTINTDGTLSEPQTERYTAHAEYCSSGVDGVYLHGGYVEDRYGDGDFRYADGVIPESEDQRTLVDADGVSHFYPIWPDDYIYFGQMLTYGWNDQRPHENVPSRIVKNSGRLSSSDESNRIYRAPAYYQSKVMDVAHFNPAVNLVAYTKTTSPNVTPLPAYPNMTAIDFAGHNDNAWTLGRGPSASPAGVDLFYQPLLDESGLKSITNRDETPNLLVYAPSEEANKKTYDVLTDYFTEPSYSDYYNEDDDYRRVGAAPTSTVFGHLVMNDLTATSDHLLVDKKDFNCPISYQFAGGKRMWYQRIPDNYVSLTDGWSTVSLPFDAELVSTQDKGEITHFYSKSPSFDANGTKTGHEYWLSEYNGITASSGSPAGVLTATFNYPTATGVDKQVNNTFLWDYYYSKNTQKDAHTDTYQTRYEASRTMEQYPLLDAAKPYMIGFPGKTFYEFDLSGEWKVKNTATTAPEQLGKQTISFVSKTGISIAVSDDEISASAIDANDYKFMPNYMSKKVVGYLMNQDGNSFDVTPSGGSAATPFRPYFVSTASAPARSILFDNEDASFTFDDRDPSDDDLGEGNLVFKVRKHIISVTSSLQREADVRITNVGGLNIGNFTIQPGETIETRIPVAGVYIIRADGGRIQKKIAIR